MFIIYDLIFLIYVLISFPLYFLRGKFNAGFLRRLGFLPRNLNLNRPIWVHAVSVGETISIQGLLARLRETYPDKKIVISTVTSTGNKIAQSLVKPGDFLTYLPLDFSFIVRHVLKKINPCMFIIAETEIWPNLITGLKRLQIPVITVNGRISDGSYGGYRLIKFFIWPILNMIKQFCVQSELDAQRLKSLGVQSDRIQVTGNVKFDLNLNALEQIDVLAYRSRLALGPVDKLLVCGSTHPKEEEIILCAYRKLLVIFPTLKLLIAPRHPERQAQICRLAGEKGFTATLVSSFSGGCPACAGQSVFILDIMGQLFNYYAAADIVFVGGSLVKKGGHNILEPASLKKPIIFGPYMFNFRQISELFLKHKAALVAKDSQELADRVKELMASNLLVKGQVQRAYELIMQNRGATEKNIKIIKQIIN